ncbi:hypothetical protein PF005_g9040 [Phytophthora fragariae]|uniref:SCP domain-containing protein n=1 Tax=Phytophthora fragariae TaxID=53985 RepID=A0A6A4AJE0_9STRA|nr:hypothetical protein PF003_g8350 [Phytophthora fragariae]KAE8940160.1 hypothetical protein PF009_g10020 [Phytophthora fragariae]KAE9031593.1 hypothetical protein PF011_g45 [Phytophthora fragariae]KAE9116948.1 hypothetical protein PF007_g9479 [Phytophthora fragariae]KAE9117291.1 hypothetical protein PF010_g8665 [Phytophthora fragariae]
MMISSVKALLTLTLVGLANACATAERELQVADVSAKMLEAVNRKRTEKGLVAVCINEKLMRAAQVLADDMAQNNFVDTTGSDGSKLADRAAAQSMNVSASAEVVAAGYSSAERVVALWSEDSDSFIYSDLPFVGPGYKYDASKRYKHYWVLDFAVAEDEVCA